MHAHKNAREKYCCEDCTRNNFPSPLSPTPASMLVMVYIS